MNRAVAKQRAKQFVRRTIGEPYVGKRFKLRRIARALSSVELNPMTILEAGCEDATFVYWLADRYPRASVTAADVDKAAINACIAARPRRYKGRVRFVHASLVQLEHKTYDLITAFDVLEHVLADDVAVAALVRALRTGGTLLVHVPRDQWTTWSGTVHRFKNAEAWRINPGHVRQGYAPESLRALLTAGGLEVVQLETWLGRWGVLAHEVYKRLEQPAPLRLLSIPVTDVLALLDARRPRPEGNTVFARAMKLNQGGVRPPP
jgi:2-polyprenyl-3-methyl-5-hydroxy-6-metoxy-1,4-benzoquinol methylase